MSCGQVFRWTRDTAGSWSGVNGDTPIQFQATPGGWTVESTASEPEIRSFLGLGDETALRLLALDPDRAEVYASPLVRGLRLMRPSCPVETLFSFLCTSNNHISRITRMVATLANYGPGDAFPTLDRIASISEDELRTQGFGYRGKTIPIAAQQILERGGLAWLESLRTRPYAEAHNALVELAGVGPKLADCIALFGLHHGHAVPIDVHTWRAMTTFFHPEWQGLPLTAGRYREAGDKFRARFGDLAGAAHQYHFVYQLRQSRGVR